MNRSLLKTHLKFQQLNQIDQVTYIVRNIEGYEIIKKSLDDLKDETEKWIKTNFDLWREQSLASISQGDLT